MPGRVLSEPEFNAVRDEVLKSAPPNMDEATYTRWVGPQMAAAVQQAELVPHTPDGSAFSRFISNFGAMVNPITIAKGLGQAALHPADTATAIVGQMGDQFSKAGDAARQGHYSEMAGHAVAGVIPVVGPMAANIGEQAAAGDVAGAAGATAGLIAPALIVPTARAATRGVRAVAPTGLRATIAEALQSKAAANIVDTISPKVGANKARFGNMAAEVAPQLAENLATDGAPMTRTGLHAQVAEKLTQAEDALDAAANARNTKLVYHTKPIIAALKAKRAALTAETVKQGAVKAGKDVVPGPNAGRVAMIDQAISELETLGPVAKYEPIRRIRQAYDGPAKAIYSPAMTADYMKAQGGKLGAADVTGVLREHLGKFDGATAKANAEYSLYRKASDVLDATEEVERTRPKVGRAIMARVAGATVGEHAGGLKGAIAGYFLGPVMDAAMNSGLTTKLQSAKLMTQLADAIQSGNVTRVYSLGEQLKHTAKFAAGITARAVAGGRPATTAAPSPASQ